MHLLAHLLDQYLEIDRGLSAARVERFRAEGVGFAIEFLHEEVEPAPGRAAGLEYASHFGHMGVQAVQFFGNVTLLCQQDHFLFEALWVELCLHFAEAVEHLLALGCEHLRHLFAQRGNFFEDAVQALVEQLG